MVVASKYDPVYMGSSFRGLLDPVNGFLQSPDEPLNRLPKERFFVTWFDSERNIDRARRRQEVFSFSAVPEKFLPYRPIEIDPTIISEDSGPLRFHHRVLSNAHIADPLALIHVPIRSLRASEKIRLPTTLSFPCPEATVNYSADTSTVRSTNGKTTVRK